MSIYGSIGYTRQNHYREKRLTIKEKEILNKMEFELKQLQNKRDAIYDDLTITDEELKELEKPIQNDIDNLINEISKIKYVKIR